MAQGQTVGDLIFGLALEPNAVQKLEQNITRQVSSAKSQTLTVKLALGNVPEIQRLIGGIRGTITAGVKLNPSDVAQVQAALRSLGGVNLNIGGAGARTLIELKNALVGILPGLNTLNSTINTLNSTLTTMGGNSVRVRQNVQGMGGVLTIVRAEARALSNEYANNALRTGQYRSEITRLVGTLQGEMAAMRSVGAMSAQQAAEYNRMRAMVGQLQGELTRLSSTQGTVAQVIGRTRAEIAASVREHRNGQTSAAEYRRALEGMVTVIRAEMQALSANTAMTSRQAQEYQRLRGVLTQLEGEMNRVTRAQAGMNFGGGTNSAGSFLRALGLFPGSLSAASAGMLGLTGMTLGLIGTLEKGITLATDFQQRMQGISSLWRQGEGESDQQFAQRYQKDSTQMGQSLLGISADLPVTNTQLTDIARNAQQLGVQGVENLERFSTTIAKLGVATRDNNQRFKDLGQLSENLAKFLNETGTVMDETAESQNRYNAALDETARVLALVDQTTPGTIDQTLHLAKYMASGATTLNLTKNEIIAVSGALTGLGANAEAGGSAVIRVLMSMNRAASNSSEKLREFATATGMGADELAALEAMKPGTQLDAFARVAGVSAEKMRELIRTSPAEAFQVLAEGLNRAKKSGADFTAILDELGLKNIRDIRLIDQMVVGHELLARAIDASKDAAADKALLDERVAKATANWNDQLTMSKNRVSAIAIAIGSEFLPKMTEGLTSVNNNSQGWITFAANLYKGMEALKGVGAILATGVEGWKMFGGAIELVIADLGDLLGVLSMSLEPISAYFQGWGAFFSGDWDAAGAKFGQAQGAFENLTQNFGTYWDDMLDRMTARQTKWETGVANSTNRVVDLYVQAGQHFDAAFNPNNTTAQNWANRTVAPIFSGGSQTYDSFLAQMGGGKTPSFMQDLGHNKNLYGNTGGQGHPGRDYVLSGGMGAALYAPDNFVGASVLRADASKKGYGNSVELELQNGYRVLLGHFQSLAVKAGDVLGQATLIGKQGNSGWGFSTVNGKTVAGEGKGPVHVHLEVRDAKGNIVYNKDEFEGALTKKTVTLPSSAPKPTPATAPYTPGSKAGSTAAGKNAPSEEQIQTFLPRARALATAYLEAQKTGEAAYEGQKRTFAQMQGLVDTFKRTTPIALKAYTRALTEVKAEQARAGKKSDAVTLAQGEVDAAKARSEAVKAQLEEAQNAYEAERKRAELLTEGKAQRLLEIERTLGAKLKSLRRQQEEEKTALELAEEDKRHQSRLAAIAKMSGAGAKKKALTQENDTYTSNTASIRTTGATAVSKISTDYALSLAGAGKEAGDALDGQNRKVRDLVEAYADLREGALKAARDGKFDADALEAFNKKVRELDERARDAGLSLNKAVTAARGELTGFVKNTVQPLSDGVRSGQDNARAGLALLSEQGKRAAQRVTNLEGQLSRELDALEGNESGKLAVLKKYQPLLEGAYRKNAAAGRAAASEEERQRNRENLKGLKDSQAIKKENDRSRAALEGLNNDTTLTGQLEALSKKVQGQGKVLSQFRETAQKDLLAAQLEAAQTSLGALEAEYTERKRLARGNLVALLALEEEYAPRLEGVKNRVAGLTLDKERRDIAGRYTDRLKANPGNRDLIRARDLELSAAGRRESASVTSNSTARRSGVDTARTALSEATLDLERDGQAKRLKLAADTAEGLYQEAKKGVNRQLEVEGLGAEDKARILESSSAKLIQLEEDARRRRFDLDAYALKVTVDREKKTLTDKGLSTVTLTAQYGAEVKKLERDRDADLLDIATVTGRTLTQAQKAAGDERLSITRAQQDSERATVQDGAERGRNAAKEALEWALEDAGENAQKRLEVQRAQGQALLDAEILLNDKELEVQLEGLERSAQARRDKGEDALAVDRWLASERTRLADRSSAAEQKLMNDHARQLRGFERAAGLEGVDQQRALEDLRLEQSKDDADHALETAQTALEQGLEDAGENAARRLEIERTLGAALLEARLAQLRSEQIIRDEAARRGYDDALSAGKDEVQAARVRNATLNASRTQFERAEANARSSATRRVQQTEKATALEGIAQRRALEDIALEADLSNAEFRKEELERTLSEQLEDAGEDAARRLALQEGAQEALLEAGRGFYAAQQAQRDTAIRREYEDALSVGKDEEQARKVRDGKLLASQQTFDRTMTQQVNSSARVLMGLQRARALEGVAQSRALEDIALEMDLSSAEFRKGELERVLAEGLEDAGENAAAHLGLQQGLQDELLEAGRLFYAAQQTQRDTALRREYDDALSAGKNKEQAEAVRDRKLLASRQTYDRAMAQQLNSSTRNLQGLQKAAELEGLAQARALEDLALEQKLTLAEQTKEDLERSLSESLDDAGENAQQRMALQQAAQDALLKVGRGFYTAQKNQRDVAAQREYDDALSTGRDAVQTAKVRDGKLLASQQTFDRTMAQQVNSSARMLEGLRKAATLEGIEQIRALENLALSRRKEDADFALSEAGRAREQALSDVGEDVRARLDVERQYGQTVLDAQLAVYAAEKTARDAAAQREYADAVRLKKDLTQAAKVRDDQLSSSQTTYERQAGTATQDQGRRLSGAERDATLEGQGFDRAERDRQDAEERGRLERSRDQKKRDLEAQLEDAGENASLRLEVERSIGAELLELERALVLLEERTRLEGARRTLEAGRQAGKNRVELERAYAAEESIIFQNTSAKLEALMNVRAQTFRAATQAALDFVRLSGRAQVNADLGVAVRTAESDQGEVNRQADVATSDTALTGLDPEERYRIETEQNEKRLQAARTVLIAKQNLEREGLRQDREDAVREAERKGQDVQAVQDRYDALETAQRQGHGTALETLRQTHADRDLESVNRLNDAVRGLEGVRRREVLQGVVDGEEDRLTLLETYRDQELAEENLSAVDRLAVQNRSGADLISAQLRVLEARKRLDEERENGDFADKQARNVATEAEKIAHERRVTDIGRKFEEDRRKALDAGAKAQREAEKAAMEERARGLTEATKEGIDGLLEGLTEMSGSSREVAKGALEDLKTQLVSAGKAGSEGFKLVEAALKKVNEEGRKAGKTFGEMLSGLKPEDLKKDLELELPENDDPARRAGLAAEKPYRDYLEKVGKARAELTTKFEAQSKEDQDKTRSSFTALIAVYNEFIAKLAGKGDAARTAAENAARASSTLKNAQDSYEVGLIGRGAYLEALKANLEYWQGVVSNTENGIGPIKKGSAEYIAAVRAMRDADQALRKEGIGDYFALAAERMGRGSNGLLLRVQQTVSGLRTLGLDLDAVALEGATRLAVRSNQFQDVAFGLLKGLETYFSSSGGERERILNGIASFVGEIGALFETGAEGEKEAIGAFVGAIQGALTGLAKGDWIGAVIAGVSGIVNGIVHIFTAGAESARKAVESLAGIKKDFQLIDVSQFAKLEQYYTGGILDLGGPQTRTQIDEFGLQLARAIEDGMFSGAKSGMKAFLGGEGSVIDGLRKGLRDGIESAIIDAVIKGAIVQGAIGGMLTDLTAAIKAGNWDAASGLIEGIGPALAGVAAALEGPLTKLKTSLDGSFGVGGAPEGSIARKQKELQDLQTQFQNATTDAERDALRTRITALEGVIEGMQKGASSPEALAKLNRDTAEGALELDYRKGLIGFEDYQRRRLALKLTGLDAEKAAEIVAAQGNAVKIAAIEESYRVKREAATLEMFAALEAAELDTLEKRKGKGLLGEREYADEKLRIQLESLRRQRDAALAQEGLTEADKARIRANYQDRELIAARDHAASLKAIWDGVGDSIYKGFRDALEQGFKDAAKKGDFSGLRDDLKKQMGKIVFDAVIGAIFENLIMGAILKPAIDAFVAALQTEGTADDDAALALLFGAFDKASGLVGKFEAQILGLRERLGVGEEEDKGKILQKPGDGDRSSGILIRRGLDADQKAEANFRSQYQSDLAQHGKEVADELDRLRRQNAELARVRGPQSPSPSAGAVSTLAPSSAAAETPPSTMPPTPAALENPQKDPQAKGGSSSSSTPETKGPDWLERIYGVLEQIRDGWGLTPLAPEPLRPLTPLESEGQKISALKEASTSRLTPMVSSVPEVSRLTAAQLEVPVLPRPDAGMAPVVTEFGEHVRVFGRWVGQLPRGDVGTPRPRPDWSAVSRR